MKIHFFTVLLSCFFTPAVAQNTLIKIEHTYPNSANPVMQQMPHRMSIKNFNPTIPYSNAVQIEPNDSIAQDTFSLFKKKKNKAPIAYPKTSNIIRF